VNVLGDVEMGTGMGLSIPMGIGIRLQFGNGNGKERERPWTTTGMTHLCMGKIPTDFVVIVDLQ